jgi:hypothetical protein
VPAIRYPSLYEINTRVWLGELGGGPARPAALDRVPDSFLDRVAGLGFDWLYLMGVWQTGPAGREVSRSQPSWRQEYLVVLPDLKDEDITGSPFAVQGYTVHADFGGDDALARFRARLHHRGLRLMLDFVPNHTALDHPWAWQHPEYYIVGDDSDLASQPQNFTRIDTVNGPLVLAHGRDPYFPGWPDTLQLNYRCSALRRAMREELTRIARQCDGVRCDMAMLILPDVIGQIWGHHALPADGSAPVDDSFWPEAIGQVRDVYPEFAWLAEVYWDREWDLQQQGFDWTYDKRLYDRLRSGHAEGVRAHLGADLAFQNRLARFLENHDEPRAAGVFPTGIHWAAGVIAYLAPGLRFFHEGQLEGRRVKVSVHLGRRPVEPVDEALALYYERLLECVSLDVVREGSWRLLSCRPAWENNATWQQFLTFAWEGSNGDRLLVAVNYGPAPGQCYVPLPFADLAGRQFLMRDKMSPARYERDGDDLASRGLYLDMPEWRYHVFEMLPS